GSPQAMATRQDHFSRTTGTGNVRTRRRKSGGQRATLVEKLGNAHPRGSSEQLLRPTGDPPFGRVTSTLRTARCGPACRVVWQGSPEIIRGPYADCVQHGCCLAGE